MNEEKRFYRMTEAQRQAYVTMLLIAGREQDALKYRDECDDYWTEHLEEWEKEKAADKLRVASAERLEGEK